MEASPLLTFTLFSNRAKRRPLADHIIGQYCEDRGVLTARYNCSSWASATTSANCAECLYSSFRGLQSNVEVYNCYLCFSSNSFLLVHPICSFPKVTSILARVFIASIYLLTSVISNLTCLRFHCFYFITTYKPPKHSQWHQFPPISHLSSHSSYSPPFSNSPILLPPPPITSLSRAATK